jgi:hypothetical protein
MMGTMAVGDHHVQDPALGLDVDAGLIAGA